MDELKIVPGFITLSFALYFLLLPAQSRLLGFALLFEEEGSATFRHFIFCFFIILENKSKQLDFPTSSCSD